MAAPDWLAEVAVLFILILTAWLVVVFFALAMFRLAALSDESGAVALAEWLATSDGPEHEDRSTDSDAEQAAWTGSRPPPRRPRAGRARAIAGIRRE